MYVRQYLREEAPVLLVSGNYQGGRALSRHGRT
ncbi:hypothetical protein J2Z84_005056 [Agrobacterium rubi]|nr:hypothetical protein [Agrobacterium rubi]